MNSFLQKTLNEIFSRKAITPRARPDAVPSSRGRCRSTGQDESHPISARNTFEVITADADTPPAAPAPSRSRMVDVVQAKDAVDFDAIPQPIPLPNGPAAQREYLRKNNPTPTTAVEKHVVATREFGYRQTAPDPKEAETRLKKGIANAAMDAHAIDQRNRDYDAIYNARRGRDERVERLAANVSGLTFVDAIPYSSLITGRK